MNGEVLRRTATKELQKQRTLKLKNGESIAEKDGEEDENGMTLPLPLAKKLGGTASNMNIIEGNLSHSICTCLCFHSTCFECTPSITQCPICFQNAQRFIQLQAFWGGNYT